MSQRNAKKQIALSTKNRQTLGPMFAQVNTYIRGVRDSLNVPENWVILNDQQGVPAAFVPPPEQPEEKKAKKKGKTK